MNGRIGWRAVAAGAHRCLSAAFHRIKSTLTFLNNDANYCLINLQQSSCSIISTECVVVYFIGIFLVPATRQWGAMLLFSNTSALSLSLFLKIVESKLGLSG